jgi:hypothetical protein
MGRQRQSPRRDRSVAERERLAQLRHQALQLSNDDRLELLEMIDRALKKLSDEPSAPSRGSCAGGDPNNIRAG